MRENSATQSNNYRNRLRNHIKNMQNSVTRNDSTAKSAVEVLQNSDRFQKQESKKKKQRGKSAAAKTKPSNTITDFYSHEISEMITRTS